MNFKVHPRLLVGFLHDNNELFFKIFKEALLMAMLWEMFLTGVM